MQQRTNRVGRRRGLALAGSLLLLLSACTGQDESAGGSTTVEIGGGQTTVPGDQTTLVAAIGEGDPMQWDPALDNEKASIHFGDTLTRIDPETGDLIPGLAESWQLSEDGTTWTFKLRPDVKFHDDWGTVTAEDVKFTWGEWTGEDADHGSRTLQLGQAIDGDLDNFEIVSDLEFRLHTTQPVTGLAGLICDCNTGLTVTSASYFAETDPEIANSHPIGTGPWKFVSSEPGVEMVLEATGEPHPYRATPSYDRLVLQIIPDGAARLAQVQSGAVDVAQLQAELTGEAQAAGLQIVSNEDIGHADVLLGGMYFGDEALDADAPWIQGDRPDSEAGLAIREALSLAIDRELIIDRILFGEGALSYAPLFQYNATPVTVDDSWTELPVYDPDLASERLEDGGYPSGFEIEILLFPQDIDTVGIGEAVAGMWEDIGIQVTRTRVEEDLVDELLATKETAGKAWVNINGWYIDANQTLANYLSNAIDDNKFFHPAIDEAYARVTVEPDHEARWEIGKEVLEELRRDIMPINLMSVNMPFVLSDNVASFDPFPSTNTINSLETVQPKP